MARARNIKPGFFTNDEIAELPFETSPRAILAPTQDAKTPAMWQASRRPTQERYVPMPLNDSIPNSTGQSIHHVRHDDLLAAHAEIAGEKHNLVIPKLYVQLLGGDITAAVVLRDIVGLSIWSRGREKIHPAQPNGFYRDEKDWMREVFLSWKVVKRCLTTIQNAVFDLLGDDAEDLIRTTVHKPIVDVRDGEPVYAGNVATFYTINEDVYARTIHAFRASITETPLSPSGEDRSLPTGDTDPAPREIPSINTQLSITNGADAPKPKTKRATQVPEDFTVTEQLRTWGKSKGFTDADLDGQVERFINHHKAKGTTYKDWRAAFQNWMHNARDYGHLDRKPGSTSIMPNGQPSPFAGRGYDPYRSLPPDELAAYEKQLAEAKAKADAMERMGS